MPDLPERLFANPVWHALRTQHRHFALWAGGACRYPADVVPFAAVASPETHVLRLLASLLAPDESVWLIGEDYPAIEELTFEATLECFQMVMPEQVTAPEPATDSTIGIVPLSDSNAREMVALTDLAYPGFFRNRTCEMGSYYGVRSECGDLIAMGGERLRLDNFSEISGVCTHPNFRGKGLAAALMWRLIEHHRRAGVVSWLHVACANRSAVELYLRIGFTVVRKVTLTRVCAKY